MAFRSSTLNMIERHCPAVKTFLDSGAPYSREIFHVGVSAHSILEDVGKATVIAGRWLTLEEAEPIARSTCEKLISEGRDFEGEVENPLPAAKIWEGRDLALAYLADKPMSPKYQYEALLAVTKDFLPCPPEGAWLKCRIDAHGTTDPSEAWWESDEEQQGGSILEVVDYKSRWGADESELYTIQRKIQCVVAWAHWQEGHEAIRLVVVNFRTGRPYDTIIYPRTPEGEAVMDRWRKDISSYIKVLSGPIKASPGACCFGCPFLQQCPDALAYLPRVYGYADPVEAAHAYSVNLAVAESMEPALRHATENEPIKVGGGYVGTKIHYERKLTDKAPQALADFWLEQAKPTSFEQLKAMLAGLVTALRPGTGQAMALFTKYLRKEKEQIAKREILFENITRAQIAVKWGAWRGEPVINSAPEDKK